LLRIAHRGYAAQGGENSLATIARALDLGCGTGLMGEAIRAEVGFLAGCDLSPRMIERARAKLAPDGTPLYDKLAVAGLTAFLTSRPDASADLVTATQALHWFDHEKALPEIGRVLRPGGVLAGLWNDDDLTIEWVRNLDRIHSSTDNRQNKRGIDLPVELGPFGELAQREFRHTQRRTAESLVATASTHSLFLTMPEPERTQTLDAMLAYLKSQPETADGEFDYPLRTEVLRTVRD